MNNYKYQLEKYSGRSSRYTCPQCGKPHRFTRYIDTETGLHLAHHVGRCDREVECGYHYKPKDYFQDNPSCHAELDSASRDVQCKTRIHTTRVITPRETLTCYATIETKDNHIERNNQVQGDRRRGAHTTEQVSATLTDYNENCLVQFLTRQLGNEAAEKLIEQYRIGTHHHWRGSTVYWYINQAQQVCSGKVMQYNPATGKRVKEPYNHVTWMHSLLGMEGFVRQPCFFGEHLLANTVLPVSLVESEKTALVAAHYLPGSIWLATGGLSSLNIEHCRRVLKGRKLTLFPDAGAYDKWQPIAA